LSTSGLQVRKTLEEARIAEAQREIVNIRVRREMQKRAALKKHVLEAQADFNFGTEGEGFYGSKYRPTPEQHHAKHQVDHIEAALDKLAREVSDNTEGVEQRYPFLEIRIKAIRGEFLPKTVNALTIAPSLVPDAEHNLGRQTPESEEGIGGGDWTGDEQGT
jgi:hypothetical protein